jgi:hypothetical protein
VTGANCFHVRGGCGGKGAYLTNRGHDALVQKVIGEGGEVIRYDSD